MDENKRYDKQDWLDYAQRLNKDQGAVNNKMSDEDMNFIVKGIKF